MSISHAPNPTEDHRLARSILDALTKKVADELEKQMLAEIEPIIASAKARIREAAEAAAREMEPSIQSVLTRDSGHGAYGDVFRVLIQIKGEGEGWSAKEEQARARS